MRSLITLALIGSAQVYAGAPAASGAPAYVVAQDKLRKACRIQAFLECMRCERATCEQTVESAIEMGDRHARPVVERLEPRHRQNPEIVNGMYLGTTLGAMQKQSGSRLNRCLPDHKSL